MDASIPIDVSVLASESGTLAVFHQRSASLSNGIALGNRESTGDRCVGFQVSCVNAKRLAFQQSVLRSRLKNQLKGEVMDLHW
ncbi:hypothetical protein SAMN06265222_101547 [Neorhodopirellula lusitana]|uniref:Uncharacterized protein n=1 Tax=Neorhodopirellula lusitana TaxID=445327 RepID=A0ABY1PTR8_9BACT|nr:hypothetical protein [Neorhodopirellula lusitana]SMP41203.1 hypothetical protein SAMN06265222_101547 [Neorhodopirellula lusitana]